MFIGQPCCKPSPRCPFNKALLQQIRLIHIFNSFPVLPHGGCYSINAGRPPAELVDNSPEQLSVDFIKSEVVDIKRCQGLSGYSHIDTSISLDLGKVPDSLEQPVCDPGRAS